MSMGGGQTQQAAPTASTTSQQTDMGPWNQQAPYIKDLFAQAGGLNVGNKLTPFSGPTVAGANPTLEASWGDMTHAAQYTPASFQSAGNYYNDVLNGKYLSPNSNPYLAGMEQAAADPLIRQYQTAIGPGTASQAAMSGRYGSGAAATLRSNDQANLAKGLGDLSNNFYGHAYDTGIQQMQGAAAAQPDYLRSSFLPSMLENQVGQQRQGLQQQQLTAAVQKQMMDQLLPWQQAGLFQGLIGGNYGQQGSTNSTTMSQPPPSYSNPMGSIFGGLMSGAGLAGQLGWAPFAGGAGAAAGGVTADTIMGLLPLAASDVRVKERIAHVGKTHDGQNLYSFRYKGDPTPHVGLMAQEVEQTRPEAVVTHPSGVKMVNYDLALRDSMFMPRMAA